MLHLLNLLLHLVGVLAPKERVVHIAVLAEGVLSRTFHGPTL